MEQRIEQSLKMTFGLRQAIELLRMPQMELAAYLQAEVEKNPLLSCELPPSYALPFLEAAHPSHLSLFDHLALQIRSEFENPSLGLQLLEHIDEHGFLEEEADHLCSLLNAEPEPFFSALHHLQRLDPLGIGTENVQAFFLLQLQQDPHEKAIELVKDHFSFLERGELPPWPKMELQEALKKLAKLRLRPASHFASPPPIHYPDFSLEKTPAAFELELNSSLEPPLILHPDAKNLSKTSAEARQFYQSGVWLIKTVKKRKQLLEEIVSAIVRAQESFFLENGPLKPMTQHALAEELQLHPSTLSRAIADKAIASPRGIFFLKTLFRTSPLERLKQLIDQEDKSAPLSDQTLASQLSREGEAVARRTIAKYRKMLGIGSTKTRS